MKGERCRRETKGHEMLRWEDASVVMVKGGGKVLDVVVGRHVSGGSEGRRANPRGKVLDVVTERNLRCEMMKRRVEVGSWQEVREKVTELPSSRLPTLQIGQRIDDLHESRTCSVCRAPNTLERFSSITALRFRHASDRSCKRIGNSDDHGCNFKTPLTEVM